MEDFNKIIENSEVIIELKKKVAELEMQLQEQPIKVMETLKTLILNEILSDLNETLIQKLNSDFSKTHDTP